MIFFFIKTMYGRKYASYLPRVNEARVQEKETQRVFQRKYIAVVHQVSLRVQHGVDVV